MRRFSTAVTITDPLVKYQSLVATGVYSPDPAQHRLARHLRSVYQRVKDYTPRVDYQQKLKHVASLTDNKPPREEDGWGTLAVKHHSIWRNPLFKHLLTSPEGKDSLALTKVLTDHEAAINIDSPKGLFLSGEVGTGKSMLLDLLAEGLPTKRKRRWHFGTFMLYVYSQLEHHRKTSPGPAMLGSDYSLLWMAKKLVEESPILFLDEFQLPDRAASKIISHVFIAFFQLGGVLVASSNRLPEELQKATGADYTPTPSKGLIRKLFRVSTTAKGELFGATSDFANFLEVLKARCDFWQIECAQDWRRLEEKVGRGDPAEETTSTGLAAVEHEDKSVTNSNIKRPHHYLLCSEDSSFWKAQVEQTLSWPSSKPLSWAPSDLVVYGRKVTSPKHYRGVVYWNFDDLVAHFGPADYISMASSYHTFVIDNVPVLTLFKKNEARRFITLLDALYEARCKLLVRAVNPPDSLFFPTKSSGGQSPRIDEGGDDTTYSETVSEVYQDQTSPFRPNISFYDASSTSPYDPDQDSDFGLQKRPLDFGNTSAFTGQDERFAYKRATSRLWEMCSIRWHARTGDWWQPLPVEARHWEGGAIAKPAVWNSNKIVAKVSSGEGMGVSVEEEQMAGLSKWRIEDLTKKDKSV